MSNPEFVINGKLRVVQDDHDHGTWTVYEVSTGRRVVGSVRRVDELLDILRQPQKGNSVRRSSVVT